MLPFDEEIIILKPRICKGPVITLLLLTVGFTTITVCEVELGITRLHDELDGLIRLTVSLQ